MIIETKWNVDDEVYWKEVGLLRGRITGIKTHTTNEGTRINYDLEGQGLSRTGILESVLLSRDEAIQCFEHARSKEFLSLFMEQKEEE